MRLVDANVLLHAVNEASPHHRRARSWLDVALVGSETLGFTWIALLAFLRLATHPVIFARPLDVSAATGVVRDWLSQAQSIVVEPTPRHIEVLASLLVETGSAGNLVSDAHVAALAIEYNAVVVTFDADFGRFRGVRSEPPAA